MNADTLREHAAILLAAAEGKRLRLAVKTGGTLGAW